MSVSADMRTVVTRAELAAALASLPDGSARALVPTMGALHAGHASLVRLARQVVGAEGAVVVSLFVNPLQFGPNEDLSKYPRPLADDLALLQALGVDVVWTPTVDDVYPPGAPIAYADVDERAEILEGASRPGHFRGVLTVVNLLFDLIRPGVAVFGEKDYQQLALITALADRRGDVDIISAPLIRDPDGLAASSRNSYLDASARGAALAIPAAIGAAQEAAAGGAGAEQVRELVQALLAAAPGVEPDYVAITDSHLRPVSSAGPARILVAARVGGVRLLDNAALDLQGDH
jgi:pantoate--beta-alanine ligase